jgi:hypothetical protein
MVSLYWHMHPFLSPRGVVGGAGVGALLCCVGSPVSFLAKPLSPHHAPLHLMEDWIRDLESLLAATKLFHCPLFTCPFRGVFVCGALRGVDVAGVTEMSALPLPPLLPASPQEPSVLSLALSFRDKALHFVRICCLHEPVALWHWWCAWCCWGETMLLLALPFPAASSSGLFPLSLGTVLGVDVLCPSPQHDDCCFTRRSSSVAATPLLCPLLLQHHCLAHGFNSHFPSSQCPFCPPHPPPHHLL